MWDLAPSNGLKTYGNVNPVDLMSFLFLNLIRFWFRAAADTRLIHMAASSSVELLFIEM